MKNMFNKLALTLVLAASLVTSAWTARAGSITFTSGSAATNALVISNAVVVYSISVGGVTGTSTLVGFIDSPTNGTTFASLTGFTNIIYAAGFTTNFYTNIYGFVETNNWYPAVLATTNTTAGYTNNYPRVVAVTGVTNQTATFNPVYPVYFSRGVLLTNNGPAVVTIQYAPLR